MHGVTLRGRIYSVIGTGEGLQSLRNKEWSVDPQIVNANQFLLTSEALQQKGEPRPHE